MATFKPYLLRSRPTFRLVLIINILNSDCMQIQLLWLDSKTCANSKQADPLYFVIHVDFNGIYDSGSIGCVTHHQYIKMMSNKQMDYWSQYTK